MRSPTRQGFLIKFLHYTLYRPEFQKVLQHVVPSFDRVNPMSAWLSWPATYTFIPH